MRYYIYDGIDGSLLLSTDDLAVAQSYQFRGYVVEPRKVG